jgi:flagellin
MQTAEGFTNTIQEITQRVRELALQGANDNYSVVQRSHIMTEITQLINETTRIHSEARFNGQNLFASGTVGLMTLQPGTINAATGEQTAGTVVAGTAATGDAALLQGSFFLQIGADGGAVPGNGSLDIAVALGTTVFNAALGAFVTGAGDNRALAVTQGTAHIGFRAIALAADTFNNAIGTFRANLGAVQNRLEFTIENLDIARENLSASESRIRDADMALEMMRLTQANVLQQAATAMLAQGNMAPQSILQLLG